MTFIRKKRPVFTGAYHPFTELAKSLSVSSETLLAQAAQNYLTVFIRVPDQVNVYSVHEDAIETIDQAHRVSKVERRIQAPDQFESRPLNMSNTGIEGLILSPQDCRELSQKREIRKYLFMSGHKVHLDYLEAVGPILGNFAFCDKRKLSLFGWRIACYPKFGHIEFEEGVGYPHPPGIEITIKDLFVTTPVIESFLDSIDTHKYIADLLLDGRVIPDRPAYFSEKLIHLIDANEIFWKSVDARDSEEHKKKNIKMKDYLFIDDLKETRNKTESKVGFVELAERFAKPVFARGGVSKEELEASPTYITPEILLLMAAAKLFWSAPHVDLDSSDTHPRRDEIKKFLSYMGFKGNDPDYGATLISPETASRGKRTKKIPVRQTIFPKHTTKN